MMRLNRYILVSLVTFIGIFLFGCQEQVKQEAPKDMAPEIVEKTQAQQAKLNKANNQDVTSQENSQAQVFTAPCPLLVPLVEEGWISRRETTMIVRNYLHPLKTRQIDTLILGCTHYPVLRHVIQRKIGARVALVDSAEAIAGQVADFLNAPPPTETPICRTRRLTVFVTDVAEQFRRTARLILQHPVKIHQADL